MTELEPEEQKSMDESNSISDNPTYSSGKRVLRFSVITVLLIFVLYLVYFLSNKTSTNNLEETSENKYRDSLKNISAATFVKKKLPDESLQKERIREMYLAFDNAFSYNEMDSYLNKYFNFKTRQKLSLNELHSYDKYSKKEHKIIEMTKTYQNDSVREFQVIFDFKYSKKNGYSDVLRCVDIVLIDHNNIVIDRKEEGMIW